MASFSEDLASNVVKDFNGAILDAVTLPDVSLYVLHLCIAALPAYRFLL